MVTGVLMLLSAAKRCVFSAMRRLRPFSSHQAMPLEMENVTSSKPAMPARIFTNHRRQRR